MIRYNGCPVPDADNDGINDEEDKCASVPGVVRYQGCPIPDTDKDGIDDESDRCPNEAGLARYEGCPVPDKDKDGIVDEEDNCPDQFGVARYRGCPVPDKDKDGVNDEDDKCPEMAGTDENLGCPSISGTLIQSASNAAKTIRFSGAKLTPASNKGLDEVAKILQANKLLNLDVEAGTDLQGAAIRAYLVKKGISDKRIRTIATGDTGKVGFSLSYF